jgi:Mitochondrial ATP synthase B chain precursor (ATP-synt_B)
LTVAIPMIKFEWYVINEETQLLAVFVAFCVTFYTQAGGAIYKAMDDFAVNILKEHTEAEEKVIEALEQKLEFLKANANMVDDFVAINEMREAAYANLNAAGMIKPQHDFKAQVERIINMIAQEEQSVADKAKSTLMNEATASVKAKFTTSKELKKAALDAAINKIKGTSKPGDDPVQAAFIQFFRDKATAAKKADDGAETAAQRAALVTKLNSVAQSERFFFQFDAATGKPKMTV